MKIDDTFHVSYCTNIHPGPDWDTTFQSLRTYVPIVKAKVAPNKRFGLGLRLSNKASEELNQGDTLKEFRDWLSENNLYVFTMNGFPYGNFHNERVKDQVHAPDWTTLERLGYTMRLFEQLAVLLPEGMSGGISTSPISYKHWYASDEQKHQALKKGAEQLTEVVLQLYKIQNVHQKYLHLDIEPEPDGLLENSDEVVHFFKNYLLPIGKKVLKSQLHVEDAQAEDVIKRFITVCYDICHFSLAYEEPLATFQKFKEEGIRVGKIQVSAALKILYKEANMEEVWDVLSKFDEPTYLHQVTEQVNGQVVTYNDLPVVLQAKKSFSELRAHFHVPIFLERFDALYSTQDHILKVIDYIKDDAISEHLEIETYTWDVLPLALKRELSESIVREINWLKEQLKTSSLS